MSKVRLLLGVVLIIILLALPLVGCKSLTLSVIDPRDGATFTESTITVKGFASKSKAIVTVNDVQVSVNKKGFYSTEITLTEGENIIKIVATRGKEVATRTVTVTYSPE